MFIIGPFSLLIILGLIGVVVFVIRRISSEKENNVSNNTFMTPADMRLRDKKEQKQIIKYFKSTGILGLIFQISDSTFDSVLSRKADELASRIEGRALETHGMDADEVNEISPILTEGYHNRSRYCKMFRDFTFRASEYQMTYLMFSEKQMYAYSYIFDLTSSETDEQTKEYFYEDITNIEVVTTQREFPAPRPIEYIIGGIAGIIIGILLILLSRGNQGTLFLGFLILVAGVVIAAFLGYSRRLVENLILRLTVADDEFVCSMKPENMAAIQGMKAKIRDKK